MARYDWSEADTLLGTMVDREIGERFGMPLTSVSGRRRRKKIPAFRKGKLKPEDIEILKSSTIEAAAKEIGVSARTIARWRKDTGIPDLTDSIRKSHAIIQREYAGILVSKGVKFIEDVPTPYGLADIVSADTVYEIKPVLNISTAKEALGQLILYNLSLKREYMIIVCHKITITRDVVDALFECGIESIIAKDSKLPEKRNGYLESRRAKASPNLFD